MTGGSRGGWRRGADTNALLVAASAASNVAARFLSIMLPYAVYSCLARALSVIAPCRNACAGYV